jgi:hypothetical protein
MMQKHLKAVVDMGRSCLRVARGREGGRKGGGRRGLAFADWHRDCLLLALTATAAAVAAAAAAEVLLLVVALGRHGLRKLVRMVVLAAVVST